MPARTTSVPSACSRQDVLWRKAASRLMNRMREGTTSIRITDQGCMLRGYHRSVIDAVNHCTEVSTYVPALAYTFARHPVEIEVAHAERTVGQSKYSLYRLIRLNFDLMTGFSVAPLQFFSMAGGVDRAGLADPGRGACSSAASSSVRKRKACSRCSRSRSS